MGWVDAAIDLQIDLHRWHHSWFGQRYSTEQMALGAPDEHKDFIRGVSSKLYDQILLAPSYVVSNDIISVLEVAQESLPMFLIRPEDLPSDEGFVHLARPMMLPDAKGQTLVVKAFGWTRVVSHQSDGTSSRGGISVMVWTDPSDQRDMNWEDYIEVFEEMAEAKVMTPPDNLFALSAGFWMFDSEPKPFPHGIEQDNSLKLFRFALTFFRYIGEPWIAATREQGSRATARRAKRIELDSEVQVITLRRSKHRGSDGDEPGLPGNWSHRWLVGGHWRNQWYPSLNDHRPKWIMPYEKGPEHLPLVVKDKVFKVSR